MAKKKTVEGVESVVEQTNIPESEAPKEIAEAVKTESVEAEVETTEVEQPTNDNQPEQENDSTSVATESKDVIPNHVLAYLKRHTEEKEVYIDKLGGVFSVNTPKVFLKDAVLYQNPFYKQ